MGYCPHQQNDKDDIFKDKKAYKNPVTSAQ